MKNGFSAVVIAVGPVLLALLVPASAHADTSVNDLVGSVCQSGPGAFRDNPGNGQWLTQADLGRASCEARGYTGWIFIGQYSSQSVASSDAEMFLHGHRIGSSAIGRGGGAYMLFVSQTDNTGGSLQPLTSYGFTITAAH